MAFYQVTTQRQTASGITYPRRSNPRLDGSRHRLLTSRQRRVKRVFDIVVSLTLICLILPLVILVALLLYLESPSSVLQKKVKIGANGLFFSVYTFRTRSRLHNFLAASSIDRLPMLLNVLEGRMSLVGPDLLAYRPGIALTDSQRADLRMPPGLFHIRDKRTYLEHYSLWLDIRVLLQIFMTALK